MRTLNLSGFKPSDSLSISVSQGALTAGPVNIPAWGETGGGGGGTIAINVERTQMQVAPDTVRFSVDLSASSFDTAGPGAGEYYDARLHDLIYLWDMGDTVTTWTKPVNVLAAWKNRNAAKGPFVQHMYPNPGTYSPSVLVIEPSSGKTAVAVLEGANAITVLDPDDVYPGTATICVSPTGSTVGAPAGATVLTLSSLAYTDSAWSSRLGGSAKRWLFERGQEFAVKLRIGSTTTNGAYFGAYGTGDRPNLVWDGVSNPDAREMNRFSLESYGANTPGVAADIRFVGLKFDEGFDPTTTRSDYRRFDSSGAQKITEPPIRALSDCCGMIFDCVFAGIQHTNINLQGTSTSKEQSWHIDDCSMTAFGGQYPIFGVGSTHSRTSFSITGCNFSQSSGAMGAIYSQGSSRAVLRSTNPHRFHMRCVDSFHTDQNQHHFVPFKDALEQGGIVNIHSCSMEGGIGGVNIYADYNGSGVITPGVSICMNAIIDGCFYFSGHSSQSPIFSNASGVTVRNVHVVQPSVSRVNTNQRGFFEVASRWTFDPDTIGAAPIKVYNCTYIYLKTDAQNVGTVEDPEIFNYIDDGDNFTGMVEQNNVIHKPNAGPTATQVTTFWPLSTSPLFTPRDTVGYFQTDPGLTNFDPWMTSNPVLGSSWNNGETKTFAYGSPYNIAAMAALGQSDFAGSYGNEQVIFGSAYYTAADGDISVSYGASNIQVTNTSGVNWVANNSLSLALHLDMGATAPVAPGRAPSPTEWADNKPLTGSAALGAALSGNVSYMDILGTTRTAPADKGAWEVA